MQRMSRIVITPNKYERVQEPRKEAIQKLRDELSEFADQVEAVYTEPDLDPSKRRVTWGEILQVYLGVKLLDVTYGYYVEKGLDKITEVIRKWVRTVFDDNQKGKPNPRPQIVNVLDEDGKLLATIRVNKEGETFTETDEYKGRHRKSQ